MKSKNAQDYAFYLLSRREYSVKELRDKCQAKFPEEDIDGLIDRLVEKDYVSDLRFTQVFVRDQMIKKIGPMTIKSKLSLKGIERDLAQEVIDQVFTDFEGAEVIQDLIEKKKTQLLNRNPDMEAYELKNKVLQYVVGRGFEYGDVKQSFNG